MADEPDEFHTPFMPAPDPISFLKNSTPQTSAIYFRDTKTLKVSITGVVDNTQIQGLRLRHEPSYSKTGFKFRVVPTYGRPALLDAPKPKLTGAGKLSPVEIPSKAATGFDDKKVLIVAEDTGLETKTYSAPITVSDKPDPDAPPKPATAVPTKPAAATAAAAILVPTVAVPIIKVVSSIQLSQGETGSISANVPTDLGEGSAVALKLNRELLQVVDASIRDAKIVWKLRWLQQPSGSSVDGGQNPQMVDIVTTSGGKNRTERWAVGWVAA